MSRSIRVVSYNVLSSELVDPERFTQCSEEDLDSDRRYERVRDLLQREVNGKAIICLQEVSQTWAGKFHVFFASTGYRMINTQWSSVYSGYMGTAIAFPADRFELLDCRLTTPFRASAIPSAPPKPGLPSRVLQQAVTLGRRFLIPALVAAPVAVAAVSRHLPSKLCRGKVATQLLPFYAAGAALLAGQAVRDTAFPEPGKFHDPNLCRGLEARHRDVLPMLKLQEVGGVDGRGGSKQGFWVGTTHMPCKFFNTKLMTAYAWQIANEVQEIAEADPYILCGDFNAKPNEGAVYELLSKGTVPADHPDLPAFPGEPEWKVDLREAMRSAYVVKTGKEPELTNFAQLTLDGVDQEPFCETLDYIWLSNHWAVNKVEKTLQKEEVLRGNVKSWPSVKAGQPSDHLLIAADLTISIDTTKREA